MLTPLAVLVELKPTPNWRPKQVEKERERERKEKRERVWCCRSYIYSVHRWIVLISDYVVPSNLLSTLTERICYPNKVRDIDLAIFLQFCIFSSGTMEKWWSCRWMDFLHDFSYGCHRHEGLCHMWTLNHSSLEKVSFFLASFRVVCRSLISFVHCWIVTIF